MLVFWDPKQYMGFTACWASCKSWRKTQKYGSMEGREANPPIELCTSNIFHFSFYIFFLGGGGGLGRCSAKDRGTVSHGSNGKKQSIIVPLDSKVVSCLGL